MVDHWLNLAEHKITHTYISHDFCYNILNFVPFNLGLVIHLVEQCAIRVHKTLIIISCIILKVIVHRPCNQYLCYYSVCTCVGSIYRLDYIHRNSLKWSVKHKIKKKDFYNYSEQHLNHTFFIWVG